MEQWGNYTMGHVAMYARKAVVILTALGFTFSSATADCLNSSRPEGKSRSQIALPTEIAAPYFYFQSFEYGYVIVVEEPSVQKVLQAADAAGSDQSAQEFRLLIHPDLPLRQSTDLMRYVFQDYYQFSFVQRLLVALLSQGQAAVFFAGTGEFLPSIEVEHENSAGGASRTFLGPSDIILMQSLDCTADSR